MSQNWKLHFKINNSTTCGERINFFKSNSQFGTYDVIFHVFVNGLKKKLYPSRLLQFSWPFSCLFLSRNVCITTSSRVVILDSKCILFCTQSVHGMEWHFLSWPVLFSHWGTLWNTFQFTSWLSKTYSAVKGDNITSSTEKDLAPSGLIFVEGVSGFVPNFLISQSENIILWSFLYGSHVLDWNVKTSG